MGIASENALPIAIIGGGLTGLIAARALVRQGRRVVVFEGNTSVGGAIRSERRPEGWLIEAGPNSLQETPAVAELIKELGLHDRRLVAAPAAKNRYILRDSRLRPLPLSPPSFLRSNLFSIGTKAHLLREWFYPKQPRLEDLPLADFFREHFGQELLDYALNPFVSGIFAGDPAKLSARHSFPTLWKAEQEHGSLLRAQLASAKAKKNRGESSGPPPIISFTDGLSTLPNALAAALPLGTVRVASPVSQLVRTPDGWMLDAAREERFDRVVLALPAPALARLRIGAPGALSSLASLDLLDHPPVTSLFLGYRRPDLGHPLDGFGVLFPAKEKRPLLGILFNSTLFPRRAPDGHVALTVMIGGARHRDLASLPLEQQVPLVQKELSALLGVRGQPVFVRRTHWPKAIPQYQLDHDNHLEVLRAAEQRHPGLHIGGGVCDGIGLPACIKAGQRLAQAALN